MSYSFGVFKVTQVLAFHFDAFVGDTQVGFVFVGVYYCVETWLDVDEQKTVFLACVVDDREEFNGMLRHRVALFFADCFEVIDLFFSEGVDSFYSSCLVADAKNDSSSLRIGKGGYYRCKVSKFYLGRFSVKVFVLMYICHVIHCEFWIYFGERLRIAVHYLFCFCHRRQI